MTDIVYHQVTPALADRRRELAPDTHRAFDEFSRAVFGAGALDRRTKQLIAVAVAHVTQCPYCIAAHTKLAQREGASPEQIMESIWVAAEMRAGGAFAHSTLALHALDSERSNANVGSIDALGHAAVDAASHTDAETGKSPWWMSVDWS